MKIDVTSLDGATAGSIELSDNVFGLEPRADLITRMIRYQLAKRRADRASNRGATPVEAAPPRRDRKRRAGA